MGDVYRLDPANARSLRKHWMLPAVLLVAASGAVGWYAAIRNAEAESTIQVVVPMAFIVLVMTFAVWRGAKRVEAQWASFELEMQPDTIRRRMLGCQDIELRRADIARIEQTKTYLVLQGHERGATLAVPTALTGFDEVCEQLRRWAPIQSRGPRIPPALIQLASVAAMLFVMLTVFTSNVVALVVPLGSLLIAGSVYALWAVRRSPHMDRKTKRAIWFLLLPALGVLLRVLSLLGV